MRNRQTGTSRTERQRMSVWSMEAKRTNTFVVGEKGQAPGTAALTENTSPTESQSMAGWHPWGSTSSGRQLKVGGLASHIEETLSLSQW